jgi:hypothetical protein
MSSLSQFNEMPANAMYPPYNAHITNLNLRAPIKSDHCSLNKLYLAGGRSPLPGSPAMMKAVSMIHLVRSYLRIENFGSTLWELEA